MPTVIVEVSNGQGDLVFTPAEVNATVGDVVQFQFTAGNHSVAKGDFANPCAPSSQDASFFSGFIPAADSISNGNVPVFDIIVNDDTPIAYYCAQGRHCQAGMVGVINPSGTWTLPTTRRARRRPASNIVPGTIPGAASTDASTTLSSPTTTRSSPARTSPAESQTSPPSRPAPASTSPSLTAPPTGSTSQAAPAQDDSSGFSRGAQAGIGIGVAVAVAVVALAVGVWFAVRRRRRLLLLRSRAADKAAFLKPELDASSIVGSHDIENRPMPPPPGQSRSVYELDGVARAELGGPQDRV